MSPLDPNNVPGALVPLLPIAAKWGIGDDLERAEAVQNASRAELEELVRSIDCINDKDLYGWLEGSESYSERPTREYLAITCLTMAIDLAKSKLRRLKSNS